VRFLWIVSACRHRIYHRVRSSILKFRSHSVTWTCNCSMKLLRYTLRRGIRETFEDNLSFNIAILYLCRASGMSLSLSLSLSFADYQIQVTRKIATSNTCPHRWRSRNVEIRCAHLYAIISANLISGEVFVSVTLTTSQ
jgi:hypothetical protein